jgi:hypothetical protein
MSWDGKPKPCRLVYCFTFQLSFGVANRLPRLPDEFHFAAESLMRPIQTPRQTEVCPTFSKEKQPVLGNHS